MSLPPGLSLGFCPIFKYATIFYRSAATTAEAVVKKGCDGDFNNVSATALTRCAFAALVECNYLKVPKKLSDEWSLRLVSPWHVCRLRSCGVAAKSRVLCRDLAFEI